MSTTPVAQTGPTDIAPPEPGLTFTEMLHRAKAMQQVLRQRQQQCEELGRLPEETHRDFLNAGFYRALQPRRFGGYEWPVTDFVRLLIEISRGCIDSGWVLSLISSEPGAFLCLFPEQAQRDAYGPHGDGRIAIVAVPGGSAVPDHAGYRVQGAWDYCSGCDISTHVLASVLLLDPATQAPNGSAYVLLDRQDYEIVDNWNMMGMQGTGSRRVVVAERTVPAHRVLPITGEQWREPGDQPGHSVLANPLYHGSPLTVFEFAAWGVVVGAARGALDIYESILRNKKWILPPFPFRFEMPELQQSFGSAQALIDVAEAAVLSLADRYMERCYAKQEGVAFAGEDVRRFARAGEQCMELAWQAVDQMFRTGGTSQATSQAPFPGLGRDPHAHGRTV